MTNESNAFMTKGRKVFLSIILAISLAVSMTPLATSKAEAADASANSYVYDYVYGVYQGKYAIAFNQKDGKTTGAALISATDGELFKVDSNLNIEPNGEDDVYSINEWIRRTTSDFQNIVSVPVRSGNTVKFKFYNLLTNSLSSATYDDVYPIGNSQLANGCGVLCANRIGNAWDITLIAGNGATAQSGLKATEEWDTFTDQGNTYLCLDEDRYKLSSGKFVVDNSTNPFIDAYRFPDGCIFDDGTIYYSNGTKKADLPKLTNGWYRFLEGLGAFAFVNGGFYVYGSDAKEIGHLDNVANSYNYGMAVPGIWYIYQTPDSSGSKCTLFNSQIKTLPTNSSYEYEAIDHVGKFNGQDVYTIPVFDQEGNYARYDYIDGALNPISAGSHKIVDPASKPLDRYRTITNSAAQSVAVIDQGGKYGVIDAKGALLVPCQYDDFFCTGSGDYLIVKQNGAWKFLSVASIIPPEVIAPVKGKTYTSGSNKYKVKTISKTKNEVSYAGTAKKSKTGSVTIPATVKIEGTTFKVTSIESSAFKSSKVSSVTVGKNVTTIGSKAFYGSKKLKKVTLGAAVKTIGKNAFSGCSKLAKIIIKSKALKSVGKNALKGINKKAKIKVPSSKVKAYKKIFSSKTGFKKTMKLSK